MPRHSRSSSRPSRINETELYSDNAEPMLSSDDDGSEEHSSSDTKNHTKIKIAWVAIGLLLLTITGVSIAATRRSNTNNTHNTPADDDSRALILSTAEGDVWYNVTESKDNNKTYRTGKFEDTVLKPTPVARVVCTASQKESDDFWNGTQPYFQGECDQIASFFNTEAECAMYQLMNISLPACNTPNTSSCLDIFTQMFQMVMKKMCEKPEVNMNETMGSFRLFSLLGNNVPNACKERPDINTTKNCLIHERLVHFDVRGKRHDLWRREKPTQNHTQKYISRSQFRR